MNWSTRGSDVPCSMIDGSNGRIDFSYAMLDDLCLYLASRRVAISYKSTTSCKIALVLHTSSSLAWPALSVAGLVKLQNIERCK
jgi:hypothetical protein